MTERFMPDVNAHQLGFDDAPTVAERPAARELATMAEHVAENLRLHARVNELEGQLEKLVAVSERLATVGETASAQLRTLTVYVRALYTAAESAFAQAALDGYDTAHMRDLARQLEAIGDVRAALAKEGG